jgi:hypothetical protein
MRGRGRCSGSRQAKRVEGPGAVTPSEKAPGGNILHRKTKRVKLHGTRVVSSELTDENKFLNDVGGGQQGRWLNGKDREGPHHLLR